MLSQLLVNALIAASIYALVGTGFALIYSTTRFFHFAHGVVFTAGAYFAFLFNVWLGAPLIPSLIAGVTLAALLGCLMETAVYRPLRQRTASPLVLLLVSLGLYIILQNVISVVFGDDIKTIRSEIVEEGASILGARITSIQITTVCLSALLIGLSAVFLQKTRTGRAMRAVASDPELASVSGIAIDRVILWTFALGSSLAGAAGVLLALDVNMTPTMGMNALMMGIIAVIVGGVNSIPGVILGALLLGLAQHLGVWRIGSQWQDAIAFVILLAFLLFRPHGFLGKRVKKATV